MIHGPEGYPTGSLDDDAVLGAYPWPVDDGERRWVRAMMVTTLDGASAGPDGLSGSISSSVDKQVFDAVRRRADAVLVGASTIREEGYGAMRAKPEDADQRAAHDQRPAPVLAIVSGSLDLPWDSELFAESSERPVVLTGADPDADALARAREHAHVVTAPDDVTPQFLVDALTGRGLPRIVCEGGPGLLESLVRADVVDEADITLSPTFAGLGERKQTDGLPAVVGFDLVHVLEAEGFLMNRYVRGSGR
ncbi:pyrimidine reductase family protein [Nocardioides marinquilinus]|uniref:Pyrimidine reductase family protein n=1 Tax=Nocardioides marinquilinus TaxID=1210400 RepID=A0ABP9PHC8_9ACTN